MPVLVTFTPLQPPTRTVINGHGRLLTHQCEDVQGHRHQQRLPVGSVRGILHLDALCLHCGAHFVWVEEDTAGPTEPTGQA